VVFVVEHGEVGGCVASVARTAVLWARAGEGAFCAADLFDLRRATLARIVLVTMVLSSANRAASRSSEEGKS